MNKKIISTERNADKKLEPPAVVVLGVGGCGCNIVQYMADAAKNDLTGKIDNIRFVLANTDRQALKQNSGNTSIALGANVTKGLGSSGNPDAGRQAAEESRDAITAVMQGAQAIYLVAGMGGGTGTGAAPVVVRMATALSIPLVAIVTRPFPFEGKDRAAIATEGISKLNKETATLIIIPNEIMLTQMSPNTSLLEAFKAHNNFAWKIVKAGLPGTH